MIQTNHRKQLAGSDSRTSVTQGVATAPNLCNINRVKQITTPMRKIEEQMNQAVANNKSWTSANTSVTYCPESDESRVYLHGNHIATVGDDFLQVFDGGWQTNTTKSRLNALINRFCNAVTDGVYQRQHVWYLSDNKVEREFESGYIFA